MATKKTNYLDVFRKWNFLIFFRLIQKINPVWARRFLYLGIADHSIYEEPYENPILNTIMFSKMFPNPVGIAAGFDPLFKYNDILMDLGFGFEEFGTITEAPAMIGTRLSFLPVQKGLSIDAREFENLGVVASQKALIARRHLPHLVGVNFGSNFEFSDKSFDVSTGFVNIERELVSIVQKTAPYCDYLVLNLTHPTLPISSLLVNLSLLKSTLRKLKQTILRVAPISKPPLLVKIPLDVTPANIPLLIDVLLEEDVDGIIIGGYLNLDKENKKRTGRRGLGFLAGAPLNDASTQVIEQFYSILQGRIPIIASAGVFTGDDAFEKIKAGANLIQIHSAILYEGPSIARKINTRLAFLLKTSGYKNVAEAVGANFRKINQ